MIRKVSLGQKVLEYARNLAIAGAAMIPFATPAKAQENNSDDDNFERITAVTGGAGIPQVNCGLSLYGSTSPYVHRIGTTASVNLTRAIKLTDRFPVRVSLTEGERFQREERDFQFSEFSTKVQAGYDSRADFRKTGSLRLVLLGTCGWLYRTEHKRPKSTSPTDSAIRYESALELGGSATAIFNALEGRNVLSIGGSLNIPTSGKYRAEDANHEYCALELSGYNITANLMHVGQIDGPLGWFVKEQLGYESTTRKMEGDALNGTVRIERINEGLRSSFEGGICWGKTYWEEGQWGGISLVYDFETIKHTISRNYNDPVFGRENSETSDTHRLGIRVLQQFGKDGSMFADGTILFDVETGRAYVVGGFTKTF